MIPACGARTRSSGKPCQRYPCKNGKCHLHGGKSTGPRTTKGKEVVSKNAVKHGMYSKEAIEERREMRDFLKECREVLNGAV